ncbi:hypothetical protein E3E12_01470 [Formicincola oecophyllae]|uniref:Uncharacterized protein n=1 Tax=Formicincola oecophyllae TaxID=2558361 RepID=A0A4Y6U9F3_9PROT|nr:hypothetical protein [Formicincola oecophyllae]QDH13086.1 hypothetical protein E3E12_01470 [Formicincola oecophyllae]
MNHSAQSRPPQAPDADGLFESRAPLGQLSPTPSAPRPTVGSAAPLYGHGRGQFYQQGNTVPTTLGGSLGWAAAYFMAAFVLQVTELLAPFLLIAGVAWKLAPRLVQTVAGAVSKSGAVAGVAETGAPPHEFVDHLAGTIPMQLELGGHVFTPGGLIFDGLLLMAVAAACATLCAWLCRR